jgi:methionyl-tRNA formyltransferase
MSQPFRIIFAGSGEFGLPTLKALLQAGHEVTRVYTQPDRPAGRGRTLTATPIGAFAESQKLQLVKTANLNAEALPAADAMVVIAFGQKISEQAANHPRLGSVNLHASLLPKHRGAAPINWAIMRGDTVAGNSVIRLAQRMDAGPVLGQASTPIGELETAGELHDRLATEGAGLIAKVLGELSSGTQHETPQDESQASLAPKLSREASRLDFSRPAAELANQIRGMFPWPGCRVRLINPAGAESTRATLVRARALETSAQPGTIDATGCIGTGTGSLEIVELQPEGKRPMTLSAFRNGHRWEAGFRVESVT